VSAVGPAVEAVIDLVAVDRVERNQGSLVPEVPGLPCGMALGLSGRGRRFGRLDEIGGWGFGRGRGIFAGLSQLFLQRIHLGTQFGKLLPQRLAVRTGVGSTVSHRELV
jgi:hypothetical protein